jgi:hypothetical protein
MRSAQKITRVQLEVSQSTDPSLIGIVSPEPDYKVSLAINRKLRIALKSGIPVTAETGNSEHSFSRFSFTPVIGSISYELFSNRSSGEVLLKKLRNVDYILSIHGSGSIDFIETIAGKIRKIELVTAVFVLDSNTVNDKNLKYLT